MEVKVRTHWHVFFRPFTFALSLTLFAAMQIACGTGGGASSTKSSGDTSGNSSSVHSVTLNWSDPGASASNVYRSSVPGGPYGLLASTSTMEYVDTSVTAADEYCYVITAIMNGVESAHSQEVCIIVPSS